MTLAELKAKYNAIAKDMRALNETIGDDAWTDEQRTQWKKMKGDLDALNAKIEREEELRDADNRFAEENAEEFRRQGGANGGENGDEHGAGGSVDEQRAQAFDAFLRHGMSDMTAEQRKVLKEMRAQATNPNEKGGYTVPTEMLNRIYEAMKDYGGLAGVSQIMTTDSGNDIEWPTSDGTAEEGVLLGENQEATEQDVEFGMETLGAKKLTSQVIRVSNELLQDSGIDIEAFLAARIGSRLGRGEARYLVKGTGAGTPTQPKGLEASVTQVTDTAANTEFTWKEINALIHSVDPAYRRANGFRIGMNDNTLKMVTEMEDLQGRPLWLPAVAGAAPATILNQAYFVDQAIADLGASAKFMFAGDFQHFIIRRVRYMVLKRLVERYAEFDQTGFLAFHRFDCVLQDVAAIKALRGAAV
ncbi:phage capsid protein [Vreelandella aquamarina]|uniref:Phage major capsid protein, HK97 family n=1 Tax=Vreelandella aquamarina TaxID=77097 RepID=A0A1N6HPZ9_9GAMM|nr:phage major capsid protein [Halomonas meridiana]GED45257.1 phage capsid protein [Halomonas meridiana]SIN62251.1 phage major capsid protein, HK97 family [Halomonas meridiana]SIN72096.1 phage major capsid protein, HK97 family [Halomonas meridiana]SIO21759.1 phage major capsid protein, HK97 family [Halomonas meridiana]